MLDLSNYSRIQVFKSKGAITNGHSTICKCNFTNQNTCIGSIDKGEVAFKIIYRNNTIETWRIDCYKHALNLSLGNYQQQLEIDLARAELTVHQLTYIPNDSPLGRKLSVSDLSDEQQAGRKNLLTKYAVYKTRFTLAPTEKQPRIFMKILEIFATVDSGYGGVPEAWNEFIDENKHMITM
jgi:hypothetical protein